MKKLYTILLLSAATIQANAQGDMESWQSYSVGFPATSLEEPTGWSCPDSLAAEYSLLIGGNEKQLFKTTDSHSGSFAAKVFSRPQGSLGTMPGIFTNGTMSVDISTLEFSLSGGTVITGRVDYVSAWIKYKPKGNDSANFGVRALIAGAASDGSDSIVGIGSVFIHATPSYTQVSVPVVYFQPGTTPNRLQILFASSDATEMLSGGASTATDSSELTVDDVTYGTFPAGINNTIANATVVKCYPVPANGMLYVENTTAQPLNWQAYDMSGRLVIRKEVNGKTGVDVSALANGVYMYRVSDKSGTPVQKGEFSIAK